MSLTFSLNLLFSTYDFSFVAINSRRAERGIARNVVGKSEIGRYRVQRFASPSE